MQKMYLCRNKINYMNRFLTYLMLLMAMLMALPNGAFAAPKGEKMENWNVGKSAAKSIYFLDDVFMLADRCSAKRWHYESLFYFRGSIELKKKNLALRLVPNRRFFEHGGRHLLTEGCGVLNYVYPYRFTRHVDATYGSEPTVSMAGDEILDFSCLSIYNEYMITDHLLSPLQRENAKCYCYRVDSIRGPLVYFSFKERRRNTQLVNGSFVYDVSRQCIHSMVFSGEYGFLLFTVRVVMGEKGDECYWPKKAEMEFKYRYLGNVFDGRCLFVQRYHALENDYSFKPAKKDKYDVTEEYLVSIDTARVIVDSMTVASLRMMPLGRADKALYKEAREREAAKKQSNREREIADSLAGKKTTPWYKVVGTVGEMLVNRHVFDISPESYFRISSPHLSFSGWKGVSYRQDVRYQHTSKEDRSFSFVATGGYNFRPKQFVWRLESDYVYSPLNNAKLSFRLGNTGIERGSDGLSNDDEDSIIMPDEDDDDVIKKNHSIVFNDIEMLLEHTFEPMSGLKLLVGGVYHDRRPSHISPERLQEIGMKPSYKSFAPRLNVEYTPCQRYYRRNNKRVAVGSDWPTMCVDWESGISGLFDSDSKYEKWEFTVAKDWTLDALHKIMAKVGGGLFTHRENVDFVEYRYFYNGIIDYNWNDDVTGVFQLLESKYYNGAYRYLRGHIAYETPTLLLRNLNTRYLRSERFYLNALVTPQIMPYLEIGYGISSHIADLSGFASIEKGKFRRAGVKFTLHLFD